MATKVINALTFGDTYVLTTPYATCSTAAGTAAKVATITPGSAFSLETGVRVSVKFTNALSVAAPTLNVNSSGAKAIYFRGATLSSAQYWAAGSTVDFVYDGTYWQMLGSQHNSTYSLSSFGITASATELNYTDGVTSNIQTQLNNRVLKRASNGVSYMGLGNYYAGGSTAKYVKISFPSVPTWTMLSMELTVRESYESGYSGRLFIYAIQSEGDTWRRFYAVYCDTLTSNIKVYASDRQHIYIEGLAAYGGLSVDKMLIGDSATASDLTNLTIEGVATLPTTYQTATMKRSFVEGDTLVGNLTGNASTATNVAWSGITSKPSYYDAKAIKGITRSGTTFTYTCMDGTTGTFTQQDNNTTYTFTNNAPTLAWGTTSTIGTVGGTALTVKLPSNPNTDTKNTTGSSNTSSKIYLVGATSQATNPVTYSHDTAYVGTDGCLYSGGTKVLTAHQSVSNSAPTLSWGTTSTVGTIGGTALTVKMPANPNSDTKVTQSAVITTNGNYPVILGNSTATTAVTGTVNKSSKLLFNPSTGNLSIGTSGTDGSGSITLEGSLTMGSSQTDSQGIMPRASNWNSLGMYNKYWYRAYVSTVYCGSIKTLSGETFSFPATITWNTF